jgi:ketosteroid isomerase-like protein
MSDDAMLAVAAAMTAAFEAGDLDAIAALYADDVVVWHNFDQLERTREQALASAAWVAGELEDFEVADLWVAAVPGGFVQQCVFRARERATGKELVTPAMLRVHVRDGRITRIEEYTDPAGGNIPDPE